MDTAKATALILLLMTLLVHGCMLLALGAGAVAGAPARSPIKGELRTTYASSLDRVIYPDTVMERGGG